MTARVPVSAPALALAGYALLFHPTVLRWTEAHLPAIAAWIWSPQTYFILATAAILAYCRVGPRDIGAHGKNAPQLAVLGACVAALPFVALWLADRFAGPETAACGRAASVRDDLNLFVLAPIGEELFFRGALLCALRTRYGARASIALSAVLFMLAHGLWAFGPLFLGVLTAWWALRYRSIVAGIFFHAVSNAYLPVACEHFPRAYAWLMKLPLLIR